MKRGRERGQVLAWNALLLAFVAVPLLMLIVDGVRLYYVHDRLQMATDAACEDAAFTAGDRIAFRDAGTETFRPGWYVMATAQSTFYNVLFLDRMFLRSIQPSLAVFADYATGVVTCQGYVNVPLVTLPGSEQITVWSSSQMGFHRR